jgi:hypothetical protein
MDEAFTESWHECCLEAEIQLARQMRAALLCCDLAVVSEDRRRGGRARPLIGRRQNSQCAALGRTECGECATAARWLREPNTRPPIIAARRGEHPDERDGGQADQQLMREPTKSAIFRYRLPRRREPVSAAPASMVGFGRHVRIGPGSGPVQWPHPQRQCV